MPVSDERGFTLPELLLSMVVGLAVLAGVLTLVQVTLNGSARVAGAVEANQRARPVLQRIIDELHSACVAPDTAPVLAGSTGSSLGFLHQTGSAVSPTPDKRLLTVSEGTMTESVYPATGGAPPTWTFAESPTSTQTLLTEVAAASTEGLAQVPFFQYFALEAGELSTTPLATPLSAADATRAVLVKIAFATSAFSAPTPDSERSVSVSDSAVLRLSPASEDTSKENRPCA